MVQLEPKTQPCAAFTCQFVFGQRLNNELIFATFARLLCCTCGACHVALCESCLSLLLLLLLPRSESLDPLCTCRNSTPGRLLTDRKTRKCHCASLLERNKPPLGGLTVRKRGYENRKENRTKYNINRAKTQCNKSSYIRFDNLYLLGSQVGHTFNQLRAAIYCICNSPTLPAGQITLT